MCAKFHFECCAQTAGTLTQLLDDLSSPGFCDDHRQLCSRFINNFFNFLPRYNLLSRFILQRHSFRVFYHLFIELVSSVFCLFRSFVISIWIQRCNSHLSCDQIQGKRQDILCLSYFFVLLLFHFEYNVATPTHLMFKLCKKGNFVSLLRFNFWTE